MRYYSIILTNPTTGQIVRPASLAPLNLPGTWGSYVNGNTIPGALNVEIDAPVSTFASPAGGATVRVWGISLAELEQSFDLNNMSVAVYGGFQKGLPLANPAQAGLLVQGYVYQALGNYVGTDQTIDLIIQAGQSPLLPSTPPGTGTIASPANLILNWAAGVPFAQAMTTTLATAFPSYQLDVKIDQNIVLANDEWAVFQTLTQFAEYVKHTSASIIGGAYAGVDISVAGNVISAFDSTATPTIKQIAFQDMIGQPTWYDPATVQVKFAMRGDLALGDQIKFPQSQVTSSGGSNAPQVNAKATFQGTFMVNYMRHVGNFRQADAASWVTIINASTVPVATT